MAKSFKTRSPINGKVVAKRTYATEKEIAAALDRARRAQHAWRHVPIAERAAYCTKFVDAVVDRAGELAEELTRQMGRPIRDTPSEIKRGFVERARYMINIAEDRLAPIDPGPKKDFTRRITREPLGVVLTLAPWNYPYLTAVNTVIPALMAGNAVILKHSQQTPLVAERFAEGFEAAGLPVGVFQHLHLTHDATARIIASGHVDFVALTGSVEAGRAIEKAAQGCFIATGLELGGKDPAYVRPDAPYRHTVASLVDGAFYNAGQSCCGIERIYVHEELFKKFVRSFVRKARQYVLGDPLDPETTLGPLVSAEAADHVRRQIVEAAAAGAETHIDPADFPRSKPGSAYLAPQVLTNVDHTMAIMTEETFGPAVGIMEVSSDEEAVALMNDSRYGLTASIWTEDEAAARAIGDQLDTGTVYMNRCDYLDPALAWVGVKDSGRGCTLSPLGYDQLTRPKSYHFYLKG